MDLSIDQALLLRTLLLCVESTTNTAVNPILSSVLLNARKDKDEQSLQCTSTNGLVAIDTALDCGVSKPGKAMVNCKRLLDAVQVMPKGLVNFTQKGNHLVVTAGRRQHKLPIIDVDNYPPIKEPEGASAIKLRSAHLVELCERVRFAVANVGEGHKERRGIYIDCDDGTATAIVIGDHLTARHDIEKAYEGKGRWAAIIPENLLKLTLEVVKEQDEVDLLFDEAFVYVLTANTLCMATRPVQEFPPWRQVFASIMPKQIARVPRIMFMESLRAVTVGGSSSNDPTPVALRFADGALSLDFHSNGAEAQDTLTCEVYANSIAKFSPKLLSDTIKSAQGDLEVADYENIYQFKTSDGFQTLLAKMSTPEK